MNESEPTSDIRIPCSSCNGALHHLFLEDEGALSTEPPWWICQDEEKVLKVGDVVEIIYLDGTSAILEFRG